MNIHILIVLYKKTLEDSPSYTTLSKIRTKLGNTGTNITFHIWNNSPEIDIKPTTEKYKLYTGNNDSLPTIYNSISKITLKSDDDILLISDDDTDYSNLDPIKIIREIGDIINNWQAGSPTVYIPKILSNGKLISPGRRTLFKGKRLKSTPTGIKPSRNIIAINSGTIITYRCAQALTPLFNVNLRFYGTDTDFFYRYSKTFTNIYILDQTINHSLSEHSAESFERIFFRWQDHFFATRKTYTNESIIFRSLLFLYLQYLKVKLSIKHKSTSFLKL